MSLRARIFIIISIIIFFILGISLFLVVRNRSKQSQTGATENTSTVGVVTTGNGQSSSLGSVGAQAPAGIPTKAGTSLEIEKNSVEQLAKVFLERYGTYSSDNNFQNIKDVETLVTASLWSKISAPMLSNKANSSIFSGITTKVISAQLANWSDAKASVELKAVRTEEKNGVINTHYQNASVDMVKINSVWLADKLVWN